MYKQKRDWLITVAGILPFIWGAALLIGFVALFWAINYKNEQDKIWNNAMGNPQLECLTLFNDKNKALFEHFINGDYVCGWKGDTTWNKVPTYDYRDASGNIIHHVNNNVDQITGVYQH